MLYWKILPENKINRQAWIKALACSDIDKILPVCIWNLSYSKQQTNKNTEKPVIPNSTYVMISFNSFHIVPAIILHESVVYYTTLSCSHLIYTKKITNWESKNLTLLTLADRDTIISSVYSSRLSLWISRVSGCFPRTVDGVSTLPLMCRDLVSVSRPIEREAA